LKHCLAILIVLVIDSANYVIHFKRTGASEAPVTCTLGLLPLSQP
jgi:hypothetical protein